MKKLILLLILCLVVNQWSNAQSLDNSSFQKEQLPNADYTYKGKMLEKNLIPIIDSEYYWFYDSTATTWNVFEKADTVTYDANSNMTRLVWRRWMGTAYQNYGDILYTYTANNLPSTNTERYWINSTNSYQNSYKGTNMYDLNNNMISGISQSWNNSMWNNYSMYNYHYDANNLCTVDSSLSWNGATWLNNSKNSYTYNANNNMIHKYTQNWQSAWANASEDICAYDVNNNQITDLYMSYVSNVLVNNGQSLKTYDANNNLITIEGSNWNGTAFINGLKTIYTYDANNIQIEITTQRWNGVAWRDYMKRHIYYHNFVQGITDLAADNNSILIYPNPANASFTIESGVAIHEIKMFDSLGKLVMQSEMNTSKSEIKLTGIAKGLYFLQITDEHKNVVNKKIVVD